MPLYETQCPSCQREEERFAWRWDRVLPCACGSPVERVYRSFANVHTDSIPGGTIIENLSATPMRFDSKSEIRRYCKEKGFTPKVEHVGVPGSDRSPHTQRFL